MKNKLYILSGLALFAALTACEPKFEYKWTSYVIMNETTASIAENDPTGILTLGVSAHAQNGLPKAEVFFELIDGTGDNGAKQGVDYTIISPTSGMLNFDGDTTLYIQIHISDANVGIYTGRKTFEVRLTGVSDGYDIGGAYSTTVTITDSDRNLDDVGIAGTFIAEGYTYYGSMTWEMTVHKDEVNPDLYWIDGLTPTDAGNYPYGTDYCAYGYYGDATEENFHIPSQVCENWISDGYYVGYTPCVNYDGNWYGSAYYPDLVFTKIDDDVWVSDYGVFLGAYTSTDISSMVTFYDVVAPVITITKTE